MTERIEALLSARDFTGALELLDQMPEEERDARWYYLRYLGQEGLEQYYEALLSLKAACERDPDHPVYQKEWKRKAKRYRRQNADSEKKKEKAENCCAAVYCPLECLDCCS